LLTAYLPSLSQFNDQACADSQINVLLHILK
jgi:hypothetical protein